MRKGETTRQQIIEQAAPVFNQRGFAGSSMQDIMEATGLEKGGLYRHFASKQELATEAFRYAAHRASEARTADLAEVKNPLAQLRRMVAAFAETPSPVPGGCPLMKTAVDADTTNPELRALAAEGFRAWKQQVAGIVAAGIERQEIRAETKPARIANLIVSTLEGALLLSRLEGKKEALVDGQSALNELIDSISMQAPSKESS